MSKAKIKILVSILVAAVFLMPLMMQISVRASEASFGVRAAGGEKGKPAGKGNGGSDGTSSSPGPAKVALAIGISDYDGNRHDLKYCDEDARDWAGYLKSIGYTVHMLIDSQATASAIFDEIAWLNSVEDSADDTVVFVYAGHGIKEGGSGSNIISRDWVYISQGELDQKFSTFASKKMFFFFDACQIGGMSCIGESGRFIAMASTSNSNAYDGTSSMANGVFTYYFLEDGIKQKGYTAMEDAFDYAEYMCEENYPMNPTCYDGYSGMFYL
ncbi:MAG: caspase family protein [Candidatus Thermoplasmatota archaeon]